MFLARLRRRLVSCFRFRRSQTLPTAIRNRCGGNGGCISYYTLPVRPGILNEIPGFPDDYDVVIIIGVAPTSSIRVETSAVNCYQCSGQPSVCIDRCRPENHTLLGSGLPPNLAPTGTDGGFSVTIGGPGDCGTFVCNNTFYLANQQVDAGNLSGLTSFTSRVHPRTRGVTSSCQIPLPTPFAV
jgi:hypothetical protein